MSFRSKYQHLQVKEVSGDKFIHQVPIKITMHDNNQINASSLFMSVPLSNENIGVYDIHASGLLGNHPGIKNAHNHPIIDLKWSPFDPHLLASCSKKGVIKFWKIPVGGIKTEMAASESIQSFSCNKKVQTMFFHPSCNHVIGSASVDKYVRLWDIEKGVSSIEIKYPDVPLYFDFNTSGDLMYCFSRDKKLRRIDVRSSNPITDKKGVECHGSTKGPRVMYCQDKDKIITTGFEREGYRGVRYYDVKKFDTPIQTLRLSDQSTGVLVSFYDPDLGLLYCAGRGEGVIVFCDTIEGMVTEIKTYRNSRIQLGICTVPKLGLDTTRHEIGRFLVFTPIKTKLGGNGINGINLFYPKMTKTFQKDLFPPTAGITPIGGPDFFFSGKDLKPIEKISLEPGKRPEGLEKIPCKLVVISSGSDKKVDNKAEEKKRKAEKEKAMKEEEERRKQSARREEERKKAAMAQRKRKKEEDLKRKKETERKRKLSMKRKQQKEESSKKKQAEEAKKIEEEKKKNEEIEKKKKEEEQKEEEAEKKKKEEEVMKRDILDKERLEEIRSLKERLQILETENEILKEENSILKDENEILKLENSKLKDVMEPEKEEETTEEEKVEETTEEEKVE